MASKYRNYTVIDNEEVNDYDEKEFVLKSEMESTLDDIESCVNNIMSLLEDVKGLNLIDDIKNELKELSSNLY